MIKQFDSTKPLSLYIHVPFCSRKCDYCAFYSLGADCYSRDDIDAYTDLIIKEIKALNEDYGKPYHTIFIGGGNPGILGYDRIRRILEAAECMGMPEECTIEINPENVSSEICSLHPYVSRVSVGVQSLNDDVLRTLGRNASKDNALRALSILRDSPFDFNADIITAVPGESIGDSIRDIEQVASFSPDHISLYCLTFEEGTRLIERLEPIGDDSEAMFLEECWKRLRELGYEHYEVSNFARPGKRCKHNMVYWNLGQYIGFGPGAESSVGYTEAVSMADSYPLSAFLKGPEMRCEILTKDETEEEYLLTKLRTIDGIEFGEYRKRFGCSFAERYSEGIKGLDRGCYEMTGESFHVTEKGMMILNSVILSLSLCI